MVNFAPPPKGWDRLASLGHPSKFQRVSSLGFVTAPTSLSGSQPNFARCLALLWAGTLSLFTGMIKPAANKWLLSLTEFCQVQNSVCVQVLRSAILAALLHGTQAVGVSQTAAFSRGRHLYSAGWPSWWASTHILVVFTALSPSWRRTASAFRETKPLVKMISRFVA